jgi:hypothetical protein
MWAHSPRWMTILIASIEVLAALVTLAQAVIPGM